MNSTPSKSALIADEVRVELTRQRRTVTDLAEGTGITLATLRRRLSGSSPFNLEELDRVAQWLGTTPTALIDRATRVGAA